jgi:UrcA family protein
MNKFVIAAASLLIAGAASANDFRFAYSEKDFSSPEAVASLHQRIESQARNYCHREYLNTRDLNLKTQCVGEVVGQITNGIDGGRRIAGVDTEQQIGS